MTDHHDSPSKLEIASHAALPMLLMVLIQMVLNHLAAPPNTIFISPYLLTLFTLSVIGLVVLWKGQICPGQKGRLSFVLPFLLLFALGNLLYATLATPKHSPAFIPMVASLFLPILFWLISKQDEVPEVMIYCGFGIVAIGVLQYALIYWVEIPSLFNGLRANNFAQILLGILLGGWYLILARSRLEGFLKLLAKLALLVLVLNYAWTALVLYQHLQIMPDTPLLPFAIFFVVQFVILALLAWILLGKNIKNPTAWTLAALLAMLYPFINAI